MYVGALSTNKARALMKKTQMEKKTQIYMFSPSIQG